MKLSGLPQFMTLLDSHHEPNCIAMVYANVFDDKWPEDYSWPWAHYQSQLDIINRTVFEQTAVPSDCSVGQIVMTGPNMTFIDYERWSQSSGSASDLAHQEGAMFKLQFEFWMNWCKDHRDEASVPGTAGGLETYMDRSEKRLFEMSHRFQQKARESEYAHLVARPLLSQSLLVGICILIAYSRPSFHNGLAPRKHCK